MTMPTVSIFDSTWAGIGANLGSDPRFPFLRVLRNPKEIRNQVEALSKGRIKNAQENYYLIHHSDVIEIADKLDRLVPYSNVIIYSGASAGVHEGVTPRSRIERNIEDFLEYISRGDLISGRGVQLASEEVAQIDRIRVWLDRAQHDYVNLLAPLDLLALAFVGGEVAEREYLLSRDRLLERLNQRTRDYLARGAENLRGMSRVFGEAIHVFRVSDPHKKYQPTLLADENRIHARLKARVLHLDDEIDRGWDLVMPHLFGSDYEAFSDPAELMARIDELQASAERFIVLLDLRLRNGEFAAAATTDELDVLHAIRAKHRAIPVHAFTACNDYTSINATMEAGANGYIWKISRALETRPDRALIGVVRDQLLDTRFDIFRSFLYRAFWVLTEGLKNKSIPPPFEDRHDRRWERRRKNLLFSLEQIVDCDFRRLTRDPGYADIALRNLIIGLYRPFEPEDAVGTARDDQFIRPHWKLGILKVYRNLSAHHGRGETPVALDIRDAMIVALLIADPATFDADLPSEFCEHIRQAVSYLVVEKNANDVLRLWKEARSALVPTRIFLLRKLQDDMPGRIHEHLNPYDKLLFHLVADRILRPKWTEQAACRNCDDSSSPPLELKQLAAATTPAVRLAASPTVPVRVSQNTPGRRRKGMDHFFREVRGRKVISFGQRYRDVVLDLADPAQRGFFRWYYEKNVMPSRGSFTDEVLSFFDDQFGNARGDQASEPVGHAPSQESMSAVTGANRSVRSGVPDAAAVSGSAVAPSEAPQPTPGRFGVSLYRVLDPKIENSAATAKVQMRAGAGPDGQALHTYGVHIEWSHPVGHPERYSLGVTARERRCFSADHRYIQLSPSVVRTDKQHGGFLKGTVAQSIVAKAAGHVSWLSKSQASAHEFSSYGQLSEVAAKFDRRQFMARLDASLQGKRVAVVKGSHTVSDHAVVDWRGALARSSIVRVVELDAAEALIVIIPENSPAELLASVAAKFAGESRPWKAVSPSAKYKDWNVLTGLATRFGTSADPVFPTRTRDEETFFVGLDLGHRSEGGSVLVATLINASGQLVCWAESVNQHAYNRRHAEQIDEPTLKQVLEAVLFYTLENLDSVPQRLVIHRDGRTLEPVERIVDWLDREFGITRVDWVDIDKQGAPIFDLNTEDGIGHYVLYEDASGRRELWLRTTAGANGLLSRPLCIVPWVTDVDIESLALEVFDLANVAAQDYGRKNRLPVTTYFADGLCATGEKRVRFWGYEHLRVPLG